MFFEFQEKASGMMEKAGNAAQGAKQSCQEVQQLMFLLIKALFVSTYNSFLLVKSKTFSIWQEKTYLIVLTQHESMFKPRFVDSCLHMEELIYLQSGEQMKSKAQEAVDAVKNTLGANKNWN